MAVPRPREVSYDDEDDDFEDDEEDDEAADDEDDEDEGEVWQVVGTVADSLDFSAETFL
jgi:hypothetical protein